MASFFRSGFHTFSKKYVFTDTCGRRKESETCTPEPHARIEGLRSINPNLSQLTLLPYTSLASASSQKHQESPIRCFANPKSTRDDIMETGLSLQKDARGVGMFAETLNSFASSNEEETQLRRLAVLSGRCVNPKSQSSVVDETDKASRPISCRCGR
jgi:hypothetical protein